MDRREKILKNRWLAANGNQPNALTWASWLSTMLFRLLVSVIKNIAISKGKPTDRCQLPTKRKQPHLKNLDCLPFIPNNNFGWRRLSPCKCTGPFQIWMSLIRPYWVVGKAEWSTISGKSRSREQNIGLKANHRKNLLFPWFSIRMWA